MSARICFVIQGFGEKQDYTSGRTLNLDASYEVIKEAVEAAGFQCVRADEIRTAGAIDVPMYEQILNADLVVADLSTYNVNAAYELGVRHALRPRTTIIVAENGLKYPFDFSHIAIRRYEHLGKDVGRLEAKRFMKDLTEAIREIVGKDEIDSPVYTYLQGLEPPARASRTRDDPAHPLGAAHESIRTMMDRVRDAMAASDFPLARAILAEVHALAPRDERVVQRLALATYKAGQPTAHAALLEAERLLLTLHPRRSHDTETVGLWGAVHKRLWQVTADPTHLQEAIGSYERGFQLGQDYYNGINLAHLLDERARGERGHDAVADAVLARRTRERVVEICEAELAAMAALTTDAPPGEAASATGGDLEERERLRERRYWIAATLGSALRGLGRVEEAARWQSLAAEIAPAQWMRDSTMGLDRPTPGS